MTEVSKPPEYANTIFMVDPSCAPEKRENGNTRRFSQESKRRKLQANYKRNGTGV